MDDKSEPDLPDFTKGSRVHCCADMLRQLSHKCDRHADPYDCPDQIVSYYAKFDEYGLIIHDGGASSVGIKFCPWCGTELPPQKRDLWFETLEQLGFKDPVRDKDLPDEFKSDAWWQARHPDTRES